LIRASSHSPSASLRFPVTRIYLYQKLLQEFKTMHESSADSHHFLVLGYDLVEWLFSCNIASVGILLLLLMFGGMKCEWGPLVTVYISFLDVSEGLVVWFERSGLEELRRRHQQTDDRHKVHATILSMGEIRDSCM
jgi:hypothetical protein